MSNTLRIVVGHCEFSRWSSRSIALELHDHSLRILADNADGLLSGAGKEAHREMHKVLDAAQARYASEIAAARKSVLIVEGKTLTADMNSKSKSFDDFWEEADYAVIGDSYRRASRVLTADLSRTYAEYLAEKKTAPDSPEDALMEAHADIAALGLVPDVKSFLDAEADKMAKAWLDEYRISIKGLSDERQEAYRVIREMSTDPQDIDLANPSPGWKPPLCVRRMVAKLHYPPTSTTCYATRRASSPPK